MLSLSLAPAGGASATELQATLENTGSESVRANTRLGVSRPQRGGELFLQVVADDGQELPFTARVNIGQAGAEHVEELAPGQSVSKRFDLAQYFQLRDRSGTLKVTATYANQHAPEGADDAWQGEVSSEPLTITLP